MQYNTCDKEGERDDGPELTQAFIEYKSYETQDYQHDRVCHELYPKETDDLAVGKEKGSISLRLIRHRVVRRSLTRVVRGRGA